MILVSSTVSNLLGKNQVAVVEPSNYHYVSYLDNILLSLYKILINWFLVSTLMDLCWWWTQEL